MEYYSNSEKKRKRSCSPIHTTPTSSHSLLSPSSSPPPTTVGSSPTSHPFSASPSQPTAVQVVLSPCAACKILRRRCVDKCVLAPYFPPTDPLKFTIAHKVFGASNIIKLLQELPESHRTDTVNSLVYEANARIRDPVYGSAGAICQLQNQISELQGELAKAKAEILNMQCQNADLVTLICMQKSQNQESNMPQYWMQNDKDNYNDTNTSLFLDDGDLGATWEPLWA